MNKLSFSINDTSTLTGICRVTLYEHINSGRLKARKLGRKTLILKSDLDNFLLSLESYPSQNQEG